MVGWRTAAGSARRPSPYTPAEQPAGRINATDPDSRTLNTPRGFLQGYNAQRFETGSRYVVAAEVARIA
jgi:hypothetical protein